MADEIEVPEHFLCPISQEIMKNPYIDGDGNSYEYKEILEWLKKKQTSPITRNPLQPSQLIPNRALKSMIEKFLDAHPELADGSKFESKRRELAILDDEEESKVEAELQRRPITLFAVIDNSGSMQESCGGNQTEDDGYSRLDLVKHTLNTIITSLSSCDRLCIVKFSTVAEVFSPLMRLNENNKKIIMEKLKYLEAENQTNTWEGIRTTIDEIASSELTDEDNIQIYLLTDGESNINPPGQITDHLLNYLNVKCPGLRPVFNTFGYGYFLDSEMLYSLARVGNGGTFGFIPDASMVGTVFINALSNCLVGEKAHINPLLIEVCDELVHTINIILTSREENNRVLLLNRYLSYLESIEHRIESINPDDLDSIDFIYDIRSDCQETTDPNLGQVRKAIEDRFINSWGKHYLRSVLSAFSQRVCINFKDKAVQRFKTQRFTTEQKRIESVFIQLPPPKPSNRHHGYGGYGRGGGGAAAAQPAQPTSMAHYYVASGGCFAPHSKVYISSDQSMRVSQLRPGQSVLSQSGQSTKIEAIVQVRYKGMLYSVGEHMHLTPYHPVSVNGVEYFPCQYPGALCYEYDGYVFDVVLENRGLLSSPFGNSKATEGESKVMLVATFGHNVCSDIFSHPYFGSEKIVEDLKTHQDWNKKVIISHHPEYVRGDDMQVKKIIF